MPTATRRSKPARHTDQVKPSRNIGFIEPMLAQKISGSFHYSSETDTGHVDYDGSRPLVGSFMLTCGGADMPLTDPQDRDHRDQLAKAIAVEVLSVMADRMARDLQAKGYRVEYEGSYDQKHSAKAIRYTVTTSHAGKPREEIHADFCAAYEEARSFVGQQMTGKAPTRGRS